MTNFKTTISAVAISTALLSVTDSNGNVIARFDGANRLRYAQGADGSAYTYDKNGNLSKATKRGPFTIPEANALTKDGPVNTVTITW